ncbi:MAG: hypothetical protein AMJ78_10670 [Omnitrophica WOR_2 bacterium SM23_29]|nr:MAG: hypothetical protein AMJ78_10670 [Omnitrophica WOR_2 bacterium SM23_29]
MRLARWAIVLLYVILVFATIPYVPRIWDSLTQPLGKNTSAVLNIGYALLGFCLILYSYFRLHKRSFTFYLALGLIFLCYGYLLKDVKFIIEKIHLLEYGILSLLVYWAIKPGKPSIKRILTYGIILGIVFAVGWTDELIQKITPGRVYEFRDVLLNWKAGILGFLLALIFKRAG